MLTIFTKIISGEKSCYKIAEDDAHIAFLDRRPLKRGHTLVVPKREVENIFDMADAELTALHLFAAGVARKIGAVIECRKVGMAVIGLEVPHVHIHLIPLDEISDTDFGRARLKFSKEEFEETTAAIRGA